MVQDARQLIINLHSKSHWSRATQAVTGRVMRTCFGIDVNDVALSALGKRGTLSQRSEQGMAVSEILQWLRYARVLHITHPLVRPDATNAQSVSNNSQAVGGVAG